MAVVNHDYPLENSMLVTDVEGNPIQDAYIRIFSLQAFEAGDVDTWEAQTLSDSEGKWVDPIVLEDGRSWVVHFSKPSGYGPVHQEITT